MAVFKVAAVFSSNMVLQRNKNISIFGQGEDDQVVTVYFLGVQHNVIVKESKWKVIIPPQEADSGYEMTVTCDHVEQKFTNIAIGEVWMAGGQSNMELELKDCKDGSEILRGDINPNVRYYNTQRIAYMDDHFYEMENKTAWSEFSEENAKNWSAVGYIFGKRLAKELGITVGIIGCNWGGSSASNWTSEESLSEDKDLSTYLEDYYKEIEGKSEEDQIKDYKQYEADLAIWGKKYDEQIALNPSIEWEAVTKSCGECPWPGPKNCRNPFRPSGMYNSMLQRIVPYTLRGFIYYQGESDDQKPGMYQKLLTRLIYQWREDWEEQTLPFLIVQLPMHRDKKDPDYKNWCLIREAQMNTYQTVKNTGIAVILDCGEFNEIHPKNKTPVGERLALQALCQVYQKITEKDAFGPIYKAHQFKAGGIELSFDYATEGFDLKGDVGGFEIAGVDKNYVNASILIQGSKIFLSSSEIDKPMYARYCWTNYGDVTIFGKNGIPLAPFRTSNRA